jgi:hypothetical protein
MKKLFSTAPERLYRLGDYDGKKNVLDNVIVI